MLYLALAFPLALLGLLALMEWIEAPLRSESHGRRVPGLLETAAPDEVEIYVSSHLRAALERHWLRQRVARLLPGR